MNITPDKYEIVAGKLFKKENIKCAVWSVVYDGQSCYQAEIDNDLSKNTLIKAVRRFEREIEYLKELGL